MAERERLWELKQARERERERGMTRVQKQAREKKKERQREEKGANIIQLLLIALSIHIMPVISPISLSALRASG